MKVFVFNEVDMYNLPVGIKNTVYESNEDLMWHFRTMFNDEKKRALVEETMAKTGAFFDEPEGKAYIITVAEYREH